MKLIDKYKEKRPVLSFEIFPPKRDTELKNIDDTLKILKELNPDYISITFGAGGSFNKNKTIELAKKVKYEYGIEPLIHLTCYGYEKNQIDELINELKVNNLENVLALRGDKNPLIEEKEDFKYASDLVSYLISKMDLCVAGGCYPEGHSEATNQNEDIKNLKKKVDSGVDFLITQLFFDNDLFYKFEDKCRLININTPISAGIMPIINKNQIERMISLCGASIPDNFKKILDKFKDSKEALFDAGISYAVSQIIDLLVNDVDGIHLYTMNNPVVARRICDAIKNFL